MSTCIYAYCLMWHVTCKVGAFSSYRLLVDTISLLALLLVHIFFAHLVDLGSKSHRNSGHLRIG